ncbi:hypothetical protein MWH25_09125, partial [Natroniella acetigena]|uniref:hypothetical protein n=1 Tax=Natroniella acetigena TaxID=52004 RepID=UPI002009F5DA
FSPLETDFEVYWLQILILKVKLYINNVRTGLETCSNFFNFSLHIVKIYRIMFIQYENTVLYNENIIF